MKSERRHQLEKNELADRLALGIESMQSYLPYIFGGLAILAVGSIGWGLYSSSVKKNASEAWTEFYFNLTKDADAFVDLANDFPSSTASGWARQIAGDNYLQRGIGALYRNKSEGRELIEQAIEAFEEVDQTATSPELRTKALLGLGQANESLGEIERAVSFYQQVAKSAAEPGIVAKANERLAFLTSESGKEFYRWFTQLDPQPDAPINLPSDLSLPPTTPDLQFAPTDAGGASSLPNERAEIDPSSLPALPPGGFGVPPTTDSAPLELSPASEGPTTEQPTPEPTAVLELPADSQAGESKSSESKNSESKNSEAQDSAENSPGQP